MIFCKALPVEKLFNNSKRSKNICMIAQKLYFLWLFFAERRISLIHHSIKNEKQFVYSCISFCNSYQTETWHCHKPASCFHSLPEQQHKFA